MDNKIVGRDDIIMNFEDALGASKKNKGSFILVSGDSGSGKTHLLTYLNEFLNEHNEKLVRQAKSKKDVKEIYGVYITCKSPINNVNIGSMEPLNTISQIIKELMSDSSITPEKKFAINVGMTLLACMPLIGEIPYAVKEISRDLGKLRSEQKASGSELRSGASKEYMEYIEKYSAKKPFCVFLDDFHWADAESVSFIWDMIDEIKTKPIIIVACYNRSKTEDRGLPLMSMLDKLGQSDQIDRFSEFSLLDFTPEMIGEAARKIYFPNYRENTEFENKIFDLSHGVPSVAAEYLDYFSKHPTFDESGNLLDNFKNNEFLPTSIQQLFGEKLDDLTEDERNILAICSAEGKEFTAIVISELLKTNVLDTIKKLRSIQNKTGIIKSIGAKYRYGLKTTVYQFTQAYYHTYFENSLEYEESVAIHSQVAAFLKERYDSASEEIQQALAPLIAAHATAAGDNDSAEEMMLKTAETAKQYGSSDTLRQTIKNLDELEGSFSGRVDFAEAMEDILKDVRLRQGGSDKDTATAENALTFDTIPEFKELRRNVIKHLLADNFSLTVAKVDNILADERVDIDLDERLQLKSIKAKAMVELGKFDEARELLEAVSKDAAADNNGQIECVVLNIEALIHLAEGNSAAAISVLEKATGIAMSLPQELMLLTLANIAVTLKQVAPIKAKGYFEKVRDFCRTYNFEAFEKDMNMFFNVEQ